MNKAYVILLIIGLGLITTPRINSSLATSTSLTQASSITAEIVDLSVHTRGTKINFFTTIRITNRANSSITLKQYTRCGFDLRLDIKTDYKLLNADFTSPCYQGTINDTDIFTYKPGYTFEYFNGSTNADFSGVQFTDIPPGFYYFTIDTIIINLSDVKTENAVYVYLGNNSSRIEYNITSADFPSNTNLPISEQISLFLHRTTSTSTSISDNELISSQNKIQVALLFTGVFLLLVLAFFRYDSRRKKRASQYNDKSSSVRSEKNNQKIVSEAIRHVCPACQSEFRSDDKFCQTCGQKLGD